MKKYQQIEKILIDFLQKEVSTLGLKNAVMGLSGGIDSAVVAILCQSAFGKNFHAFMLPSSYSSSSSLEDALALCEKFDIKHSTVSIAGLLEAYFADKQASSLRIGNFSARLRMSVLYDMSAKHEALVIGTSNKSELLLGYGTIFGDIACAINPIGELYKTQIFEFARYLGVPESIINKPPSADLWEGQSDEAELGYTYVLLDQVLSALVDEKKDTQQLLAAGFEPALITFVQNAIEKNEFKGKLPRIASLR